MSFINEYLIEINQTPIYGRNWDLYTVKDFFFYDSNTKEYGCKDTIIPVSVLLNKEELPDVETIRSFINSKIPIMRRVIDINNQKESWLFDTNILEETKK